MDEVASAIGSGLGKTVKYVAIPPVQYRQGLLDAKLPAAIVDRVRKWFDSCRAATRLLVTNAAFGKAGNPDAAVSATERPNLAAAILPWAVSPRASADHEH
jgi:hypothetical protein